MKPLHDSFFVVAYDDLQDASIPMRVFISTDPERDVRDSEPRSVGWCGERHGVHVYAHGVFKDLTDAEEFVKDRWPSAVQRNIMPDVVGCVDAYDVHRIESGEVLYINYDADYPYDQLRAVPDQCLIVSHNEQESLIDMPEAVRVHFKLLDESIYKEHIFSRSGRMIVQSPSDNFWDVLHLIQGNERRFVEALRSVYKYVQIVNSPTDDDYYILASDTTYNPERIHDYRG